MEFGYFTLSDNHYENNKRAANQFVADIVAEAIYADKLGMHSAWIGEHHFNSLGVLSCPDLVLAYVAANTKRIRLAPAVTVLPLHHPIRVAEQWATLDLLSGGRVDFAAGRGYDRREYEPFHVVVRRQPGDLRGRHGARAPAVGRPTTASRITASITRSTTCASRRSRCSTRSRPMSARSPSPRSSWRRGSGCGLIVAPFAAAMSFGGLKQVADLYHETCAKHGTKPRPADVQLLHPFRRHQGAGGRAARAADPLLPRMRDPGASRAIPKTAPPSYRYFIDMVERLSKVKPEDLTENSVLIGSPARITDMLKKGRGRRLRRGDPLFQRRPEAARSGEGRDGALHGRGRAGVWRRGEGERGVANVFASPVPGEAYARRRRAGEGL